MPALESFLTLEFSLARRLEAARRETMAPVAEEIVSAAKKDRYDIAHDIVNKKISFEPMLAKVGAIFEITGLSAFVLGAATFRDGDVTATSIMRGAPRLAPVDAAISGFADQFRGKLLRTYQDRVHRELIKLERESREGDDVGADSDESEFVSIFAADIATEAARLNSAVASGKAYVDIGANMTTSRLTSYGYLSESMIAGVQQFQRTAVLDDGTCAFCRALHGRIFKVPNALQQLQDQLLKLGEGGDALSGTPFPVQSLKKLQGGMDADAVQEQGLALPPSHPLCRCTMVRVGNVPKKELFNEGRIIRAPIGSRALAASLRRPGGGVTSVAAPVLDDAAAELAAAEGISEVEALLLLEDEALERSTRAGVITGSILSDEGDLNR